jgi:uncharacterized repeat protein (TIGR03803 family)
MKARSRKLFRLLTLIAALGLILAGRATAHTFTALHSFMDMPDFPFIHTNTDGGLPYAVLIVSGNTLYGTTQYGGSSGWGVVFAVNTDGTGFTNLHRFALSDGASPMAGLILSGDTLYGTASRGGPGFGTVFAVNTDGSGFTNVYTFTPTTGSDMTNSDGASPVAGLILSGNTLYGTTRWGGSSGNGTVFKVNTDGSGFTNLHNFTPPYSHSVNATTNSDGANPLAGLILSGNTLYGTAATGGTSGKGTVFAINTDGTGFTNLHSFTATPASYSTNSDGANPWADLILSRNTLYGTAQSGGSSGKGTVFAINTDGTGFTNLHSFTATSGPRPGTNSDGANPWADLILSGNTLYGTAEKGGSSGKGTVFAINIDGTGFTTLYNFTETVGLDTPPINGDGSSPRAGLMLSGNTLFGTANEGGSSGFGTVFSLSFAPQLTIIPSGGDVILTWPTNNAGFDFSGFTLQSTTNLVSPAVWTPVVPSPVVVNGQNTVTNPLSGNQQYYRLSE